MEPGLILSQKHVVHDDLPVEDGQERLNLRSDGLCDLFAVAERPQQRAVHDFPLGYARDERIGGFDAELLEETGDVFAYGAKRLVALVVLSRHG